jgi:hypothetical protein
LKTGDLPGGFPNAWNQACGSFVTEANAADAEFAIDRSWPTADFAPQPNLNPITRGHHLGFIALAFRLSHFTTMLFQFRHLAAKPRFTGVC